MPIFRCLHDKHLDELDAGLRIGEYISLFLSHLLLFIYHSFHSKISLEMKSIFLSVCQMLNHSLRQNYKIKSTLDGQSTKPNTTYANQPMCYASIRGSEITLNEQDYSKISFCSKTTTKAL